MDKRQRGYKMDDFSWKELPLLIYVIIVAGMGGIISSIEEQRKERKPMSIFMRIMLVITNALTSGFAGVLTYWLYASVSRSDEPSPFMFFLVGVSGWLGGSSIKFFIAIWKTFVQSQAKGDRD